MITIEQLYRVAPCTLFGVSQNRIREISAEMCKLLDEQSALLTSATALIQMTEQQLTSYTHRNERINQLSKELAQLV
jgi:hypothetical protein